MKIFGFREISEVDLDLPSLGRLSTLGETRCGKAEEGRLQTVISLADILLQRYGANLKAFRLVGDSMEGAGYYPGDVVLVAPLDVVLPRFGKVVAVKIGASDPIVKRYQPNGLFSEYANGRKVKVPVPATETAQIIGTVVWHIHDAYLER